MNTLPRGAKSIVRSLMTRDQSGRLVKDIERWLTCSGPEWTTDRLKAIRQAAYQLKAGNRDLAREIYQKNSIAYDRSTLIPKGMWGYVVSGYVSAKKPSVIRKFDTLLRLYTCLRLQSLSQRQLNKSKASITAPQRLMWVSMDGKPTIWGGIIKDLYRLGCRLRKNFRSPIGDDGKVVVDLNHLSPTTATHIDTALLYGRPLSDLSWGKHIMSLWTSVWLPDSLASLNPAEKLRQLLVESGANNVNPGHISFLQEGGCKARVVAVPNVWIQLLMEPLHRSLSDLTKTSWLSNHSSVHDQNRGAYFLREVMSRGETVYCHDLSSATDRFPLEFQTAFLKGLGCTQYAEALEEISSAPWIANNETWSYSAGQPMGLYSSFPLFNAVHICLLYVLKHYFGGDFRVLGDDVIITGEKLSDVYTKCLKAWGMEFSVPKCITSTDVAEFAGFTVYRTNKGITSHRPFKYSGRHGYGSAVNRLYHLGSSVRKLGPYWSRKYDDFVRTLSWRSPDLTPLFRVGDDEPLGGVRLNSHRLGSASNMLSWSLRYEPCDSLLDCYEEQQIILLGQKEIVRDGFASANDNVELSPGANPDEPVETKQSTSSINDVSLSSDPLMNQIQHNREGSTTHTQGLKDSHVFG